MSNGIEKIPVGAKVLTEALQQRAKEELNETEENTEASIKALQELIDESELKCSKNKDFLLRFLRIKKFKIDESFASLTHYTHHFSTMKSQVGMPDADLIKNALQKKTCVLLPYRDSQGRAVIVYRSGLWIEEEIEPEDSIKALICVCHYLLEDPATQVAGVQLIIDVEKFSFSDAPFAVEYCRVLISMLRFYPARFKRIDVVNEHIVFSTFMSLIKPLLPSKLSKRIAFHGKNRDSLLQHYDEWLLPEVYGGTLSSFDNDHFMNEIDKVANQLTEEILTYADDD